MNLDYNFIRFLSEADEDRFLNMFSFSIIKLNSDAAAEQDANKFMALKTQHLNWLIEFMNFLKKYFLKKENQVIYFVYYSKYF